MNKLKTYYFDAHKEYPSELVYKMIKEVLLNNSPADTPYKQKLAISDFIRMFTTEKYLDVVIRFLRINKILKNENQILKQLDKINPKSTNFVKCKAQLYGVLLEYETQITYYFVFIKNSIPILQIKFLENAILHNMGSIASELIRVHNLALYKYLNKLPPKIQKETYSQLINSFVDFDYRKETKHFTEDIEFFKLKKENVDFNITPIKTINPNPRIFVSDYAYLVFKSYAENIKFEIKLAEFSFLFCAMKNDSLIYGSVGNIEFVEWLQFKSEFKIEIDRIVKVYDFKTTSKAKLYQTLKDLHKA